MKKLTLSALIIATTTMQPVLGMHPVMSSEIVKSKMKKLEADISAMSANLAYVRSRGLRNEAMHFITVNSPTSRSSSRPALPDIVGDVTARPITPVDQGTIKAPDTVKTVLISGDGFFRVDSTNSLLGASKIDVFAEMKNYIEVMQAFNRAQEERRLEELLRRHAMSVVRLLDDDTPQDPTTVTRRQMNRALNELLSNPPQLRHIVPPEK